MIILLDAVKAFDKIQHPFIIKVWERSGIQGPYLNCVSVTPSMGVLFPILRRGKVSPL